MKNFIEVRTDEGGARLFKGRPLSDCPKTYKFLRVIRHSIGNAYNSDLLSLYKNRQGVLKYEIYRDGCFYPYYGNIEFTASVKQ